MNLILSKNTRKGLQLFALFILTIAMSFPLSAKGIWDIHSFGAKGDGKSLDTQAIQNAIDGCHNSGGGTVLLQGGNFLSGTIRLKSNVTLHIESGAVLLGSSDPNDYPTLETNYPAVSGEYSIDKTLVYAENAENIAIVGNGTINGRGDELEPMVRPRPHTVLIRLSKNVRIRDIRLHNAAFWVQKYQSCNNLLIDGITVDSRENKDIEQPRFADVPGGRNTDGCNIVDCSNVRISNCNIDSGDDGIVFKSFLKDEGCHNVTVSNCVITTNASGIKIGTESAGTFNDIAINNCVIYDTRGAAIGLMTVDGASIERVIISNMTLRNIKGTAIFLRLGNRARIYEKKHGKPQVGKMKDILIENIYGTEIERYGCSITGIEGGRPENIVLNNINLGFKKGLEPLLFEGYPNRIVEEFTIDNTPEIEDSYPRGEMFGKLPAYGFYIRHVDDIQLDGIRLKSNDYDKRPAIVADDVSRFAINRLSANASVDTPALIFLRDVKYSSITQSVADRFTKTFLQISGAKTQRIVLENNDLEFVKSPYIFENSELKKTVKVQLD